MLNLVFFLIMILSNKDLLFLLFFSLASHNLVKLVLKGYLQKTKSRCYTWCQVWNWGLYSLEILFIIILYNIYNNITKFLSIINHYLKKQLKLIIHQLYSLLRNKTFFKKKKKKKKKKKRREKKNSSGTLGRIEYTFATFSLRSPLT